nr:hypothetical protein CFP56_34500 [Quercus suber]
MALKLVYDVEVGGFDDELSATKIVYLAKNFRNFLRNNNRKARGYDYVKSECPTFLRSKGKAMTVTLSDNEVSDDEFGCDEDENFIAFTAIAVVNESISVEENPSDGELSKDADLQEAYNKLCKVAAKDAMNVELSLKKIDSLKLEKKILLLKLFDANDLLNHVKSENMLLLDKVKTLEHDLSITRSASSKLYQMLNV